MDLQYNNENYQTQINKGLIKLILYYNILQIYIFIKCKSFYASLIYYSYFEDKHVYIYT